MNDEILVEETEEVLEDFSANLRQNHYSYYMGMLLVEKCYCL